VNWDMVGALGELVGALAVVLTLIYLGRQVRQASEEAQRNRFGNLNDEISRVADSWGSEDALSDIVFRGLQDPLSLTPHEAFRFNSSVFRMFKAWESVFQYASEGGVHQWGADGFHRAMTDLIGMPGMQKYWADRSHWFSAEFVAEVERILPTVSPTLAESYRRSEG
jgi:hypothetical protein